MNNVRARAATPVTVAVCSRPLSEQYGDRTGAVRRIDHPNGDVDRIDLLPDDRLDLYRSRFPDQAELALSTYDALEEALDREVRIDGIREAMERRFPKRPVLGVAVCLSCGAFEVVKDLRAWPLDRAMRRAKLSEREALAVQALVREVWRGRARPTLDAFSGDALRELRDLVGHDVDEAAVRARYEVSALDRRA